MIRLIDANALLKSLKSGCENCSDANTNWCEHCCKINDFEDLIDNAPTVETHDTVNMYCDKDTQIIVEQIRPQGEWIPVSERLPEQANQSYLVTVDYGDGVVCSCQRFFFNEDIGWNDDCVIAWQPLPEPYKEGGKDGVEDVDQ